MTMMMVTLAILVVYVDDVDDGVDDDDGGGDVVSCLSQLVLSCIARLVGIMASLAVLIRDWRFSRLVEFSGHGVGAGRR